MFISKKLLGEVLERLDRLETIIASSTGIDKEALRELTDRRKGSACPAVNHGAHSFRAFKDFGGYCGNCGMRL